MDLAAVRSVPAARSMQACAWCVGCVDGALPLPLARCTGRSYMRLVGRCVCGCLVVEPGAQGSSPVARLQLRRGVGVVSGGSWWAAVLRRQVATVHLGCAGLVQLDYYFLAVRRK